MLVSRHEATVYRYASSLTRDAPGAEDAMQQAFLDLMRGAGTWQGQGSVRSWLLTLTRNAVYRGARRRAGEPPSHESLAELAIEAGWGADPETLADRSLTRARVHQALERLDPTQREIILLRDLQELTGPETAQVLGLSLAAMKSRLHRARLALTASLREESTHGS